MNTKSILKTIVFAAAVTLLAGCGAAAPSNSSLLGRDDTVKHAYMEAKGEPDPVRAKVYASLDTFEAKVTDESWQNSSSVQYRGDLVIKLPSSKFLEMVNWLKDNANIKSMSLYAREVDAAWDDKSGTVVNGKVFSYIYLNISREMGFAESFRAGLEGGADALKTSLRTIVPVLSFLAPYGVVFVTLVAALKALKKGLIQLVRRAKQPAAQPN